MPELQTILNQWDQDGDGQISKEEAMAAAQQMQKVQDKNKKLIILVAICVVIMGIMLALTIAANEISKDFKPKEGNNMIAKDGSVVATASNVAQRHITDLVNATTSELEDLHFVTLEIDDKSLHYKLAGFVLDHDAEPPSLTLLTFTADKIFIQNDKIWVINGTSNPVEWIEVPQTDLVNATIANEKFHTLKGGRGGGRGRSKAGRSVGSSVAGGKTTSRSAPKTVNTRTPVPTTYRTTRGGKTYQTDKRCLNPGTWEYCNLKECAAVRDSLNCN